MSDSGVLSDVWAAWRMLLNVFRVAGNVGAQLHGIGPIAVTVRLKVVSGVDFECA